MFSINIISLKNLIPFLHTLNTYLIAAREKFQILKNGSDYQGAWPPLVYGVVKLKCSRIKIKVAIGLLQNNVAITLENWRPDFLELIPEISTTIMKGCEAYPKAVLHF